jgi:hypothetical protein
MLSTKRGGTIPARAAAGKNTNIATEPDFNRKDEIRSMHKPFKEPTIHEITTSRKDANPHRQLKFCFRDLRGFEVWFMRWVVTIFSLEVSKAR